ncbi:MAG: ribosome-associated translation inhibitor RaiA [Bacteroidales bacterium]|nr:ribosome-associated translation inhibitor RaiA [Bacteroidales bacterium]
MNIKINSVKFKADPKLENFVNNKVSKLERTFDNITSCEVSLKVDKPESDNNKIVEIQLVLPGQTLFNSKQADTFEDATLQVVDATKMQLSKYKERFNKKNGELKTDLYEMSKEKIEDEEFDNSEEFDEENEQ